LYLDAIAEVAVAERLRGKVAVVTGAGSQGPGIGNGKAAAVLFAREGARVLCVDLVEARAAETAAMVTDEGARPPPSWRT